MARKNNKKARELLPDQSQEQGAARAALACPAGSSVAGEPAPLTSLNICRNKHWRFISSFHGPWLQLPPELLESLAHTNFLSPRPHPIDPAVFFDLVRIRRLVDEAATLAVRAANGTASSALSASLSAGHHLLGGGNGSLSGERKQRMRELATRKLSDAYHLDEIAASVASMQAASSLEDVARLVLLRSPPDRHARYVHFFHEKIPSRALAESTSLRPLSELVDEWPRDPAVLRTRALTSIFKDDLAGAARDLTDALSICRHEASQHTKEHAQAVLASSLSLARAKANWRDPKFELPKLADEDKPTGLQAQLLFQRAGVYLSIACQSISKALQHSTAPARASPPVANGTAPDGQGNGEPQPQDGPGTQDEVLEARRKVKTFARRALRDYLAFLSHLEYTPGFVAAAGGDSPQHPESTCSDPESPEDADALQIESPIKENGQVALVSGMGLSDSSQADRSSPNGSSPRSIKVYQVSNLFAAAPPTGIPPYPPSTAMAVREDGGGGGQSPHQRAAAATLPEPHETVTYHPLLTEALHALLLCHSLVQTSAKEHLRHAYMVARLVRLSDGYPVFLAARSASRADWVEVVRRTDNFLALEQPWEQLCSPVSAALTTTAAAAAAAAAPAAAPATEVEQDERDEQHGQKEQEGQEEQEKQKKQKGAEEERQLRPQTKETEQVRAQASGQSPSATASHGAADATERRPVGAQLPQYQQHEMKAYSLSTERAECVVRWIRAAPLLKEPGSKAKRGKKKGSRHGAAAVSAAAAVEPAAL